VSSIFSRSEEGWTAEDVYRRPVDVSFNTASRSISVDAAGDEAVYFVAPSKTKNLIIQNVFFSLSMSLHFSQAIT
jgi:hypothetical protein